MNISSKILRTGLYAAGLTSLIVLTSLFTGCDKIEKWRNRGADEKEVVSQSTMELLYQTATLEMTLAQSGKPYLVFDIPNRALEIRLKGTILLAIPIKLVENEPGDFDRFVTEFGSKGMLLRPLAGKYLFESFDQTPDSVLAIVSEVLNVKAELLQREIPERFRIYWNDKLNMDVVSAKDSAAVARPKPKQTLQERLQGRFEDMKMEVRYVMRKPFGVRLLVLETTAENALTLYRISNQGLPTLLQLVSNEPIVLPAKAKKKK